MPDNFPPARQRAALERFAAALNSSPRALRRDQCGDPPRERRRELGAMAFKNLRLPAGAVLGTTLRAAP